MSSSHDFSVKRSTSSVGTVTARFQAKDLYIADSTGGKVAEAGEEGDAVLTATFDLEAIVQLRTSW